MTTCTRCHSTFERDPGLEVPCRVCNASVGRFCAGGRIHACRQYDAEKGPVEPCKSGSIHQITTEDYGSLFQQEEPWNA